MLDNFGVKDIIDIVLVAIGIYELYYLVKKSGSTTIFKGIVSFLVIWILVSKVFEMRLLGAILDTLMSIGVLVIVILFQDEIRRFLITLGSNRTLKAFARVFGMSNSQKIQDVNVTPIVLSCMNMAKSKTGALIVIRQEMNLNFIEETGEIIDANLSSRLIENIFFKNSPLHDGAMVISHQKIKAAGCILPISQNQNIPKYYGLRHRAAIGITEETDAKVIVVSEERGKISFIEKGQIKANITPEKLQELLSGSLSEPKSEKLHTS